MDDVSAGKLASCICAYEFEDKEPAGELSDRENFYWSNIADILKEVKETERAGKVPKKFNLQSRHFTFYETYYNAMKLMNICKRGVFVKAICAYMFGNEEPKFADRTIQGYFNLCKRKIEGSLFGSAERYKTDLDWGDVAAKYDADEELKNVRNIFQLVRRYEQKYSEKW